MFRFTIRDVLWSTVVVGMGCAWFIDGRYNAARFPHLEAQISEARTQWATVVSERDRFKLESEYAWQNCEFFKTFANNLQSQANYNGIEVHVDPKNGNVSFRKRVDSESQTQSAESSP